MTDAASSLGALLAGAGGGGKSAATVSAQVIDVCEDGSVNLLLRGAPLYAVPCADAYRNRASGDWVAVRPGAAPVVLWRLGADPGSADEDTIREVATEVAADLQVVRSATWGTGAPPGSGWQTVNTLYVRKNGEGKVDLYAQVASVTDPSPTDPDAIAPSPKTISPTDSGSWRNSRPDEYHTAPTQGTWTGGGNIRGAWFYGTAIAAACSGRTVASMKATFTRKRGSGVFGKRPMHLYLHSETSAPSGQLDLDDGPQELLSLSVGGTGTATLPASWRTALASGSARGLAIYAQGSTDYAAFTGGKIKITFSA